MFFVGIMHVYYMRSHSLKIIFNMFNNSSTKCTGIYMSINNYLGWIFRLSLPPMMREISPNLYPLQAPAE